MLKSTHGQAPEVLEQIAFVALPLLADEGMAA